MHEVVGHSAATLYFFALHRRMSVRKSGSVVPLWLARHRLPTLAIFSGDRVVECVGHGDSSVE
ncbi:hypothetical protein AWB74_08772 [Caballeronia arvi]|uniref:Uncharacterized protein n=1 Tax=Caballeronia arvi TaxID=1777135 RepID=A0A158L7A1_9BURK|nr:hypothetical protein [Caballeronia arvi]SAL88861.1 hypothetical protein AWB74_08772 [Caballeronia arvi]